MPRPRSLETGVTLVELLLVLVIVAVLAMIAIPGYRRHVLQAHRTEAQSALLHLAAAQQKFHLQNDTYAAHDALTSAPPAGLGLAATTEHGWYTITIAAGAGIDGFTATATATGGQAADTQCATFTIDQAGARSATHPDCW